VNHGKKVALLPDNFMGDDPSPDLLASDSIGDCYVEVKRLTEDHPSVLVRELLNSLLAQGAKRCRIDIVLRGKLAPPVTKREERAAKEALIQAGVDEFSSWLESQDLSNLPLEFQTGDLVFNVHGTNLNRAYVGVVHTDVHRVPIEDWVKKLREDVTEKAKKRTGWTGKDLEKLYIVVIDCEEISLERDDVDAALIGYAVLLVGAHLDGSARLSNLGLNFKEEWRQFLRQKHIIPSNRVYLDPEKKGVFFTKEVMRNVSAVIVRFATGSSYCLPNPFCYEPINNPKLQHYLA